VSLADKFMEAAKRVSAVVRLANNDQRPVMFTPVLQLPESASEELRQHVLHELCLVLPSLHSAKRPQVLELLQVNCVVYFRNSRRYCVFFSVLWASE
jgi:hypothetical protein